MSNRLPYLPGVSGAPPAAGAWGPQVVAAVNALALTLNNPATMQVPGGGGINPMAWPYNAKGNADTVGGGADDTDRLQAALTKIQSVGGGALILPARFRITKPLTYSGSYLSVIGYGPGTGIINDSATTDAIQISGAGECNALDNFEIRTNDSLTPTNGWAVNISGTTAFPKLTNMSIRNVSGGIQIVGTSSVSTVNLPFISSCELRAIHGTGMNFSNVFELRLWQIHIDESGTSGVNGWLIGDGVQDVVADTVTCLGFGDSLLVNCTGSPVAGDFRRCVFDGARSTGLNIVKGNILDFHKCWMSTPKPGASAIAIGATATNLVSISECNIANIARYGIIIGANAIDTTIENNRIYNCGLDAANTYDAVNVAANTNSFYLRGNTAKNTGIYGGVQRYGIVVNAGTSDDYMITDNALRGNGTGGLLDGGTGMNKIVADNLT